MKLNCELYFFLLLLNLASLSTANVLVDEENTIEDDSSLPEENGSQSGGLTCANVDVSLEEDDLPNYDLLRRFQLDSSSGEGQGEETSLVEKIEGTGPSQSAYRLKSDAQFALATADLLPGGLPAHFSFSCTFRNAHNRSGNRSWTLLRINDYNGEPQFGLRLMPASKTVQLYSMVTVEEGSSRARLEQFNFTDVPYFEESEEGGSWSKVHLSVTPTNLSLYVNCQRVGGLELDGRKRLATTAIDLTGDVWLAKYDDDFSTVPLDIQWMVMNCDASRPQRDRCSEISKSQHKRKSLITTTLLKSEPRYVVVTDVEPPPPVCCQPPYTEDDIRAIALEVLKQNLEALAVQFKGTPGRAGRPGKSIVGPPGPPGEKGERGDRGERGFVGQPGAQGVTGNQGPRGEKGESGSRGPRGETGPQGLRGPAGRTGARGAPGVGYPGTKGETGPSGPPGVSGVRGPAGPVGPPGVCEMCKAFNFDTLQLLLSQGQRQIKGPFIVNTKSG
ncbi:hypothetical protein TYRP_007739 [Tyrophagus putrescentiae]|nr:hypothetical protein TYRP_007739 [Tyrophagus putrescentiae]